MTKLPRLYTPFRQGRHFQHVLELHPGDQVFCRACNRYLDKIEAERAWPHEKEKKEQ